MLEGGTPLASLFVVSLASTCAAAPSRSPAVAARPRASPGLRTCVTRASPRRRFRCRGDAADARALARRRAAAGAAAAAAGADGGTADGGADGSGAEPPPNGAAPTRPPTAAAASAAAWRAR